MHFEARFPALYRKALAMRPAAPSEEPPSPVPRSPPPPFRSEPQRGGSFRAIVWAGQGKEDDDDFDLRKAPLVGPLASGLEKMREAGNLARSDSGTPPHGHFEDYPTKARDMYADDYDHDYDEIDPKSEGLRNDPGFQRAGAPGSAGSGAPSPSPKAYERGGEESSKKTKKRPQLWERLRSGK